MRTYASDNVYLGIGHNQFTFDFSNFQVCTNSVNEINFNESLIPGDFRQFGELSFLWR